MRIARTVTVSSVVLSLRSWSHQASAGDCDSHSITLPARRGDIAEASHVCPTCATTDAEMTNSLRLEVDGTAALSQHNAGDARASGYSTYLPHRLLSEPEYRV